MPCALSCRVHRGRCFGGYESCNITLAFAISHIRAVCLLQLQGNRARVKTVEIDQTTPELGMLQPNTLTQAPDGRLLECGPRRQANHAPCIFRDSPYSRRTLLHHFQKAAASGALVKRSCIEATQVNHVAPCRIECIAGFRNNALRAAAFQLFGQLVSQTRSVIED